MIRGRDDVGEIPLTAGIALGKFRFPFIIESRQFVIVFLSDSLEVDGLPGSGDVVSHNAMDSELRGFLVTLFKPVAVSGSENSSSWNLATILMRLV